MTFKFKTNWKTTTALCVVSTIVLAGTTAYASGFGFGFGGLSKWDSRPHINRFFQLFAEIEKIEHGNGGHNVQRQRRRQQQRRPQDCFLRSSTSSS